MGRKKKNTDQTPPAGTVKRDSSADVTNYAPPVEDTEAARTAVVADIMAINPAFNEQGVHIEQCMQVLADLKSGKIVPPEVKPEEHPTPIKDDAAGQSVSVDGQSVSASDEEPPKVKKSGCLIAPGKAITCLRGMLSDGDKVCLTDFSNGKEDFERLVDAGLIIKG